MTENKPVNWNIVFLVMGVFLIEILLLVALLGNWISGIPRTIAWIVFIIIITVLIIVGVMWLINFLWKKKGDDETKTLSHDDCMKLSNKILLFQYGIIPSTTKHSKQQIIKNVNNPIFFRKVFDMFEEKVAYVGIVLANNIQEIGKGNPKDFSIIVDPKDEREMYDAMMSLSGTIEIKNTIRKIVTDETGEPIKQVDVQTNTPQIDLSDDEESPKEKASQKELARTKNQKTQNRGAQNA